MLADEELQGVLKAASKRAASWGHTSYDPMHILIQMYCSEKNAVYPILNKYGFNEKTASMIAKEVRPCCNPLYYKIPLSASARNLIYSAVKQAVDLARPDGEANEEVVKEIRISSMDVFRAMLEHRPRCPDVINILTAFAPFALFREEANGPPAVKNQVKIEEV